MIHISVKTDYAILLMLALAERYNDGRTSLRSVAREKRLPYRFLGSIAHSLKKSGLIDSKEGATGGYYLLRAPSRISVGDIVRAIDGPTSVARCMTGAGTCPKFATCTLPPLWTRVTHSINTAFDRLSLSALLRHPQRASIRL